MDQSIPSSNRYIWTNKMYILKNHSKFTTILAPIQTKLAGGNQYKLKKQISHQLTHLWCLPLYAETTNCVVYTSWNTCFILGLPLLSGFFSFFLPNIFFYNCVSRSLLFSPLFWRTIQLVLLLSVRHTQNNPIFQTVKYP